MLLPGPEATQLATYLGWLMHGTAGALVAGGLFLLPSVAVLLSLSAIYALWGQLPALVAVFWALKPAVLGIVLLAAWRLGRRTLHHPVLVAIAVAACLALSVGRMPYPALIGATGLLGWIGGRLRPTLFRPPSRPAAAAVRTPLAGRVLHGDDDPTPDHARFSPRRLGLTLLGGGLALGLPLTLLTLASGWDGPLATMARFFTRVALVSFGGAYAVLPYVAQGAVETHGWLDAAQMVDGLALGETTPGPLIMVVAFVGFMGGWNGSGSLAAGVVAALVVVWFSFLPSFLFILAGGPLVEASREDLRVGPLQLTITAAVVGVILSLALYLAGPALAPRRGPRWGRRHGAGGLPGAAGAGAGGAAADRRGHQRGPGAMVAGRRRLRGSEAERVTPGNRRPPLPTRATAVGWPGRQQQQRAPAAKGTLPGGRTFQTLRTRHGIIPQMNILFITGPAIWLKKA